MVYSRNTVVPENEFLNSELGSRYEDSVLPDDGTEQTDAPRLPENESVIV